MLTRNHRAPCHEHVLRSPSREQPEPGPTSLSPPPWLLAMSYYHKVWTEERIERHYKEGRGSGVGAQYRPLLEVHDVPSLGLARRAPGVTTGRVHHLLSNVEYQFFLMLDWAADITDIREQYPVNRELTQDMALTLRIKHPCYPGTNVATLMSTDFLVNRLADGENTLEAFDIKRSEAAEDERTLEKLELMRASLEELQVPHRLVYHSMLPKAKIERLEWIRFGLLRDGEHQPFAGYFEAHCARMAIDLATAPKKLPLNEYCSVYDARCSAPRGTGLRIAQMLMHNRVLIPNLAEPDLAAAQLGSFKVSAIKGALRLMEAA